MVNSGFFTDDNPGPKGVLRLVVTPKLGESE